jgi:hypothetical protein
MASTEFKKMVRFAISISLLLVLCLPAGARIHGPISLEEAGAGPRALVYAPMPKGGGVSLLTTGRRANFNAFSGFFKIDWAVGRIVTDSIPPLLPFSMGLSTRLHHRADRTAISVRAPPR